VFAQSVIVCVTVTARALVTVLCYLCDVCFEVSVYYYYIIIIKLLVIFDFEILMTCFQYSAGDIEQPSLICSGDKAS